MVSNHQLGRYLIISHTITCPRVIPRPGAIQACVAVSKVINGDGSRQCCKETEMVRSVELFNLLFSLFGTRWGSSRIHGSFLKPQYRYLHQKVKTIIIFCVRRLTALAKLVLHSQVQKIAIKHILSPTQICRWREILTGVEYSKEKKPIWCNFIIR